MTDNTQPLTAEEWERMEKLLETPTELLEGYEHDSGFVEFCSHPICAFKRAIRELQSELARFKNDLEDAYQSTDPLRLENLRLKEENAAKDARIRELEAEKTK